MKPILGNVMKSFGVSVGKFQFNFLVCWRDKSILSSYMIRKNAKLCQEVSVLHHVSNWEYGSSCFATTLPSVFETCKSLFYFLHRTQIS